MHNPKIDNLSPLFVKADRVVVQDTTLQNKELRAFMVLLAKADRRTNVASGIHMYQIAKAMNMCIRSAREAVSSLHEKGLIRREFVFDKNSRDGKSQQASNFYIIGGKAERYLNDAELGSLYYCPSPGTNLPEPSDISAVPPAATCRPIIQEVFKESLKKESIININKDSFLKTEKKVLSWDEYIKDVPENMREFVRYYNGQTHRKRPLSQKDLVVLTELSGIGNDELFKIVLDRCVAVAQKKGKQLYAVSWSYLLTAIRNELARSLKPQAEIPECIKDTVLGFQGDKPLTQSDVKAIQKLAELGATDETLFNVISRCVDIFSETGKDIEDLHWAYIAKAFKSGDKKASKNDQQISLDFEAAPSKLEKAREIIKKFEQPIQKNPEEIKRDQLFEWIKRTSYRDDDAGLVAYLKQKVGELTPEMLITKTGYGENEQTVSLLDMFRAKIIASYECDTACTYCSGGSCPIEDTLHKNYEKRPDIDTGTTSDGQKSLNIFYKQPLCKFKNADETPTAQNSPTLNAYETSTEDTVIAKAAAIKALKKNKNLILAGKAGTGKTHLAKAIHEVKNKNSNRSVMVNVAAMLDSIKRAAQDEWYGVINRYKNASCLILDDLGKESMTDKNFEILFGIVDHRYKNHMQTIITTNAYTPNDLCKPWCGPDKIEPLISRVLENGEWVTMTQAENYRYKGKR